MNNFFKYLPHHPVDCKWGMYTTVAGYTDILPKSKYPPPKHPNLYSFTWEKGRKIPEFQLIYITKGKGCFETAHSKRHQVVPGCMLFIFPGVWHRYRPDCNTGWQEFYVGFTGDTIHKLIDAQFFTPEKTFFQIGLHENIIQLYDEIFETIKEEKSGYQQYASGIIFHLLSQLLFISRNKPIEKQTEKLIQQAKITINHNLNTEINWQDLAKKLNVSYSKFRKDFKNYVGISPAHYHTQLKINKAKELLIISNNTLKEIAYKTGFKNEYYFSTVFKQKVGCWPGFYRKQNSF